MDYDDKDFQSQNLRLDCEGNNTVRPFTLPKFDFDDILQGHLRFDNLVETGVFLGIESQEENCWIEDFSRGGSGIEFSPRAAESCSISRRNNAWFEATSSESVEMLLKSVGQEEFIPEKTILESNMHDEYGNLTMQMVPILNQDDCSLSKADIVDASDTYTPGMLMDKFPQSIEDVGPEPMHIDDNLQSHDGESSANESQINLEPRTDGEKFILSAIRGNLLHNSKCSDMTQTIDDLSMHDFPARPTDDVSATEMQAANCLVDNLACSQHKSFASVDTTSNPVCNKMADKMHNENLDVGEENIILSNQLLFDGHSLQGEVVGSCDNNAENPVGAEVDSILGGNVAEIKKREMKEPSSMILKEGSDLQNDNGCSSDVCISVPVQSKKCEVLGFRNDNVCPDYYEDDTGNDIVVSLETPSNTGNCPSLDRNLDIDAQYNHSSSIDKENVNFLESDHQMGTEILACDSKAYQMSIEEDYCNVLNCGNAESSVSHLTEGSHSILARPSSGFIGRKHEIDNIKRHCDSFEICKKELILGVHSPSPSLGDNPESEKNIFSKQTCVHKYSPDDSEIKSETELLNDVNNVESVGVRLISKDNMNLTECNNQRGTEILTSNSEAALMSEGYCEVFNCENGESGVSHEVDGPDIIGKKFANLLENDHQTSNEILVSKSEASLISMEYSKVLNYEIAESAVSHVVAGIHSVSACSSPDFVGRKQELEKIRDPQKNSEIFDKELFSGVHPSSFTESEIQVGEKNIISGQSIVHKYNQGDSDLKREAELPIDVSSVECQSVGLIVTKQADAHNVNHVDAGIERKTELLIDANNVEREGAGLIVTDMMLESSIMGSGIVLKAGFQLASQGGVVNDDVIDSKSSKKLCSPVIRPSNFEMLEENVTSMSTQTRSSPLNDCIEDINVFHVISSVQKDALNTEQLIHETVNQPRSLGGCLTMGDRGDSKEEFNKIGGEFSDGFGECLIPCDSVMKDNNMETRLPNNLEGETLNAPEGSVSTERFLESDVKLTLNDGGNLSERSEKPDCGSPSTIISDVNSQHVNELQKSVSPTAACLLETDNKSAMHEGGSGSVGSEKTDAKSTSNDVLNIFEGSDKSNRVFSTSAISCVGQHVDVLQEEYKGPMDVRLAASGVNDENTEETCSVTPIVKGNDHKNHDKSFTSKITPPIRGAGKSLQASFSDCAGHVLEKFPQKVVDDSYSSPPFQMDPKLYPKTTEISVASFSPTARVGSKSTDRKVKRASAKSVGKEVAKKVKHLKDVCPMRQSEGGDELCILPPFRSAGSQLQQPDKILYGGNVECGGSTKTTSTLSSEPSYLPDLNASASTPVLFHQPFTDIQQLQLRAQILVYGSLISGSAPDEACMIAAFGSSDVGRSSWEKTWRAYVERAHNKKLHSGNFETPSPSCPVGRSYSLDSSNHGAQSRILSSPVVRPSNRVAPSPVVNSMMAISSPPWNICTPSSDSLQLSPPLPRGAVLDYHPPLSPLPTYQSPALQNFIGHASWLPQAPFSVPWISSPQSSSLIPSVRFSTSPTTVAPLTEYSLPRSSGVNPVFHSLTASPTPLGNALLGKCSSVGVSITPVPHDRSAPVLHDHSDLKSRKRKNIPISSELSHIALPSSSIASTSPVCSVLKTDPYKSITAVFPSLTPNVKSGNHDVKLNVLYDGTLSNVKESKLQAEDASVHAAAAVCYCEEVWSQIGKQNNFGLVPEIEATLTSAAAVVAASATIAKAASSAAKIASNIALHSKLLADEALHASGNHSQITSISRLDETCGASSVIGAAREAARKRVEAASAASKQAEILVALVKSAELASEAVSQAGKVVTMGDPVALSQLIEAGPRDFWKLPENSSGVVLKSNNLKLSKLNTDSGDNGSDNFAKCSDVVVEKIEHPTTSRSKSLNGEGELAGQEDSSSAQTVGVAPVSEFRLRSASINISNEFGEAMDTGDDALKEGSIKVGSLLEVYKDSHGYKPAWYKASALSLEDGKVHVCYTDLKSDDELGMLKEWMALDGEGEKAPRVRIARPIYYSKIGKRQRSDIDKCAYSVGDRVDAWLRTCWCEGVIAETPKNDESVFTVSFPGETSGVKAWHLRSSLVWNDGEWVEWSGPRQTPSSSHEVDAPREKRPRLTSPNVKAPEEKPEQSTSVPSRADFKPTRAKVGQQSGSQKEGPRVIFGVPPRQKKKKKFMEVSKHYVAGEKSKMSEKEGDSGASLLGRQNVSGFGGNATKSGGGSSFVFSATKKLGNAKADHKGRAGPPTAKVGRIEEDSSFAGDGGRGSFEAAEPRRSNRRIQPTSRLLEGLQSSMVASKIPSHDRTKKPAEQKHVWRN